MSSFSENEKQKVQFQPVNNTYRFGDGKLFPTLQNVDIPIILGNKSVMLNTDVVASDIPFAFTKKIHEKSRHDTGLENVGAMQ